MFNITANYKLQYSSADISRRIKEVGQEVTTWVDHNSTKKPVLAMCILRGGMLFFSDLIRNLDSSVELTLCRAKSYSSDDNKQTPEIKLAFDMNEFEGRKILIVDDICDSGRTLREIQQTLEARGAKEVASATLIHRVCKESVYNPKWACFRYDGGAWFVGYGMEDKNQNANLPDIYVMN